MKILVTGGTGFIGSHIVDRLVGLGEQVVVLSRRLNTDKLSHDTASKIQFVEGDIREPEIFEKLGGGYHRIYHIAGSINRNSSAVEMEIEIIGTHNLVQFSLSDDVEKLIYISTCAVYGGFASNAPIDETVTASPTTSYSIAKRLNEIYLHTIYKEKGLQSCVLRVFNVYGPRQDSRMVIPRYFEQAISGHDLTIFGKGQQTRDFIYIDDVTDAAMLAAGSFEGYEIFNVTNGQEYSIEDLARRIVKISGSDSQVKFEELPASRQALEVDRMHGSFDKLARLTGYRPKFDLDAGLKLTCEHIKTSHG